MREETRQRARCGRHHDERPDVNDTANCIDRAAQYGLFALQRSKRPLLQHLHRVRTENTRLPQQAVERLHGVLPANVARGNPLLDIIERAAHIVLEMLGCLI